MSVTKLASLASGTLTTTSTALYSVPANYTALVTIELVNGDTATRTVNVYLRRSGANTTRIFPATMQMKAGYLTSKSEVEMAQGDSIMGSADSASIVDYTIFGATRT